MIQKSLGNGITLLGTSTVSNDEGGTEEAVTWQVRVAPEDTDDVAAGTTYEYDLEVHIGDDVYTVLMGSLTMTQDVTRNGT